MKKLPLLLAMVFSLIILQGCASKSFHVEIDSITQTTLSNANTEKYCIISGNKQMNTDNLYFLEVVDHIKPYLEEKGLTIIKDILAADNVIFLDFGVSDPIQKLKTTLFRRKGLLDMTHIPMAIVIIPLTIIISMVRELRIATLQHSTA